MIRRLVASLLTLSLIFVGVPLPLPPQVVQRLPEPVRKAAEIAVDLFHIPEAAAVQLNHASNVIGARR